MFLRQRRDAESVSPDRSAAVFREPRPAAVGAWMFMLAMSGCLAWSAAADSPPRADAAGAIEAATLQDPAIRESSGLAVSNRTKNRFWTHNDSGGKPIIYAFDPSGNATGRCRLKAARAKDWEDIASYREGDRARLLIADCGDNDSRRADIELYLIDEPDPDAETTIEQACCLKVSYEDGPRDCEAVAVDGATNSIVLVTKSRGLTAGVYQLPLPVGDQLPQRMRRTAIRIGTLPLPMITAMDIDASSGDIWVVNYFHAWRFACRRSGEDIRLRIGRLPQTFELPRWKQIEAAALDNRSRLWVTTEGTPALLGRVDLSGDRQPGGQRSVSGDDSTSTGGQRNSSDRPPADRR